RDPLVTGVQTCALPIYTTTDETGQTYVYDAWNRLVKVGTSLVYAYDGCGRRIKSGSTDLYYSSDWQVLQEDLAGNLQAQYVWSPDRKSVVEGQRREHVG